MKVIAINGSYRKGGITDQAIDAVLGAIRERGGEVKKIYLTDKQIEFCTNCRVCTQDKPEERRGKCVFDDDMNELLSEIDSADGLILGSPVNFSTVTAIMKRFIERLVVYAYWPWDKHIPANRIKKRDKKAIIITSSGCPALIGRILLPSAISIMKEVAGFAGAKVVKTLYFGCACREKRQKLSEKEIKSAESAGSALT